MALKVFVMHLRCLLYIPSFCFCFFSLFPLVCSFFSRYNARYPFNVSIKIGLIYMYPNESLPMCLSLLYMVLSWLMSEFFLGCLELHTRSSAKEHHRI
jgi:hypothetical protein